MLEKLYLLLYRYRIGILALTLVCLGLLGYSVWKNATYATSSPAVSASPITLPEIIPQPTHQWNIFTPDTAPENNTASALRERFRLSGTFSRFDENGNVEYKIALVDDLSLSEQQLLGEGDVYQELYVKTIEQNAIIVHWQGEQHRLTLGVPSALNRTTAQKETKEDPQEPSETVLETSRFGKRIATDRWVVSRPALEEYYRELLDAPERVAALFESFNPLYNDQRKITGYEIDGTAEMEFLEAMGLNKGDQVRLVNSMQMTSQRRAEYFIRSFAKNQLNTIVMEVDRDGEREKMIYLIR